MSRLASRAIASPNYFYICRSAAQEVSYPLESFQSGGMDEVAREREPPIASGDCYSGGDHQWPWQGGRYKLPVGRLASSSARGPGGKDQLTARSERVPRRSALLAPSGSSNSRWAVERPLSGPTKDRAPDLPATSCLEARDIGRRMLGGQWRSDPRGSSDWRQRWHGT